MAVELDALIAQIPNDFDGETDDEDWSKIDQEVGGFPLLQNILQNVGSR